MVKILITGGSGFIGTNMIDFLQSLGVQILNYDIIVPKKSNQICYWKKVDILNREHLFDNILNDKPDYIVHLAARTDLNENYKIDGYGVNIEGVRNIMDGANQLSGLKKIIIASSMLVCKLGYVPVSFNDYAPNSLYGESKVLTEKIVKEYDFNWTIVRPTSIWGPWFGEPYKNFFKYVISGIYFNIPQKYSSTKTYGFVENTCKQIYSLLINDGPSTKHNYFYLGDSNPINITEWANKIRKLNNQSNLLTLPKSLLKNAAKFGDFLKIRFGLTYFPMNSFRYNNMTNNNIIHDLVRTIEITQIGANTNFDEEILKTLKWIKSNK